MLLGDWRNYLNGFFGYIWSCLGSIPSCFLGSQKYDAAKAYQVFLPADI